MSRKHFRLMAANLLALKPNADDPDSNVFTLDARVRLWTELVSSVADVCKSANPSFNRGKFYAACGIGIGDNEGGG